MQVINMTAFGIAGALLCCGAFVIATTVIGSDLAEKRMSFLLSRPFHSFSIWSGKMVSALLIPAILAFIVLIPPTLVGGGLAEIQRLSLRKGLASAILATVAILFAVALGHHLGVVLRARSKWILLDFLVIPFLLLLGWFSLKPFVYAQAFGLVIGVILLLTVISIVALLASGYTGLSVGRVDIRGVHRVTSMMFMTLFGLAIIVLAVYSQLVLDTPPQRLSRAWMVNFGLDSDWIALKGGAPYHFDYTSSYLVSPSTGKTHLLHASDRGRITIAAGGSRAAWEEIYELNPLRVRLSYIDLPDGEVVQTEISYPRNTTSAPALSADGRLVAFVVDDLLAVVDIAEQRSVTSARLPEAYPYQPIVFQGDESVRLYRQGASFDTVVEGGRQSEIITLDLATNKTDVSGRFRGSFVLDPENDRLLRFNPDLGEYALLDGRTADVLVTRNAGSAVLLSNGGALFATNDAQPRLEIVDAQGLPVRTIDVGPWKRISLGGETRAGTLLVSTSQLKDLVEARVDLDSRLIEVDLETSEFRELARGFRPAIFWRVWNLQERPGAAATRVVTRATDNALLYIDEKTGEFRLIGGEG